MVGQEDHYMKTLGRRECSFTNGERLSSDTLKELSPSPLSTNELNYPFQKNKKQNKTKKTQNPKKNQKPAALLASTAHRFHSGKKGLEENDDILQRTDCTFNFY